MFQWLIASLIIAKFFHQTHSVSSEPEGLKEFSWKFKKKQEKDFFLEIRRKKFENIKNHLNFFQKKQHKK